MKKFIKHISILFSLAIFAVSCVSLSARESYERGDYFAALEKTASEVTKVGRPLTGDEREEVRARIASIERNYQNIYRNSRDSRSQALASYNLWVIGDIIEKNPILNNYTDFLSRESSYDNLSRSINSMISYVNESPRTRVRDLESLVVTLQRRINRGSQYFYLVEQGARRATDIYVELAISSENVGNYRQARDYYGKAYGLYDPFNSNYRNVRAKYNQLTRRIELEDAEVYFNRAVNEYNRGEYSNARSNFETARSAYSKYSEINKVRQIDDYFEFIDAKTKKVEKVKNFREYYNRAIDYKITADRQSNIGNRNYYYKQAIDSYRKSLEYAESGSDYEAILREIQRLEAIIRK